MRAVCVCIQNMIQHNCPRPMVSEQVVGPLPRADIPRDRFPRDRSPRHHLRFDLSHEVGGHDILFREVGGQLPRSGGYEVGGQLPRSGGYEVAEWLSEQHGS